MRYLGFSSFHPSQPIRGPLHPQLVEIFSGLCLFEVYVGFLDLGGFNPPLLYQNPKKSRLSDFENASKIAVFPMEEKTFTYVIRTPLFCTKKKGCFFMSTVKKKIRISSVRKEGLRREQELNMCEMC